MKLFKPFMYGALLSVKTNIFSLLNNIDRVPTSSYNHSNKSTAGKHPICTIALHSSKCHFQFGMCIYVGISIKCVTFENDRLRYQIFISKHWIIELGYQYWLALIRRSGVGGGHIFLCFLCLCIQCLLRSRYWITRQMLIM